MADQIDSNLLSSAVQLSSKIGLRLKTVEDAVVKFSASTNAQVSDQEDVLVRPSPDYRDNDIPASELATIDRYTIDLKASLRYSVWYAAGNKQYGALSSVRNTVYYPLGRFFLYYRLAWREQFPPIQNLIHENCGS